MVGFAVSLCGRVSVVVSDNIKVYLTLVGYSCLALTCLGFRLIVSRFCRVF